jgi:hypothetical protein
MVETMRGYSEAQAPGAQREKPGAAIAARARKKGFVRGHAIQNVQFESAGTDKDDD